MLKLVNYQNCKITDKLQTAQQAYNTVQNSPGRDRHLPK